VALFVVGDELLRQALAVAPTLFAVISSYNSAEEKEVSHGFFSPFQLGSGDFEKHVPLSPSTSHD
jgi:hypothetical protein